LGRGSILPKPGPGHLRLDRQRLFTERGHVEALPEPLDPAAEIAKMVVHERNLARSDENRKL